MTLPPDHGRVRWKGGIIDAVVLLIGSVLLGVIFWSLEKADPMWAVISFILVYDPEARSILPTALARLLMTIIGSILAMGAVMTMGLHKWTLPLSLAIVAAICALFLQQRSSRRIVLVTVALIVGSSLLEASEGTYIALMRSIEVTVGSLLAAVLSWAVGRWAVRGG